MSFVTFLRALATCLRRPATAAVICFIALAITLVALELCYVLTAPEQIWRYVGVGRSAHSIVIGHQPVSDVSFTFRLWLVLVPAAFAFFMGLVPFVPTGTQIQRRCSTVLRLALATW